ncbi:Villin-1 [Auxenochlorella protothecoides]|uniref:Villin-1 n=1 Tax=Auxenochlorella protothecoides TaxID=3075 RepID=A0A087SST8_AUXPR|nr:Villin-1 [Auxenochlorella protothecoides]KFM28792.1 Villin-1 [Auxenochlorella protothecoides]RMZ55242.1 hypothetical protein APUTEX25_005520 [Auxenochlorella protothecoides]|eukprot:RMZ55242.1 hypothetical protein APUTEX25_005520 [Auxenochlorella protothecoides]
MTAHIELWKVASDGTIAAVPQPTNALDSGAAYVLLGNQDPRRVFAWIGSSATQAAKEGAQRHAAELVEAMPSIAASLLHMEGGESEAFRALGPAADSAKAWDSSIAVAARIAVTLAPGEQVFPVEELKGLRAESGINMTRKEDYLSPADFEKVFGKTREEFKAQPAWRQTLAKKQVGLW